MGEKYRTYKRQAVYIIVFRDPDYKMLKRQLRDNLNGDLFSAEGLRNYAERHYGAKRKISYSAGSDYLTLTNKADLYPEAIFILRWTGCMGLFLISHTHYVYMRKRYADTICNTIRRIGCQKREAS